MTQHNGHAEGKYAYHYNADNKSPRRAPQGPLLGSSLNHCRSPSRKLFIVNLDLQHLLRSTTQRGSQQHTGRSDQGEESNGLGGCNSAQEQRLPIRLGQATDLRSIIVEPADLCPSPGLDGLLMSTAEFASGFTDASLIRRRSHGQRA